MVALRHCGQVGSGQVGNLPESPPANFKERMVFSRQYVYIIVEVDKPKTYDHYFYDGSANETACLPCEAEGALCSQVQQVLEALAPHAPGKWSSTRPDSPAAEVAAATRIQVAARAALVRKRAATAAAALAASALLQQLPKAKPGRGKQQAKTATRNSHRRSGWADMADEDETVA